MFDTAPVDQRRERAAALGGIVRQDSGPRRCVGGEYPGNELHPFGQASRRTGEFTLSRIEGLLDESAVLQTVDQLAGAEILRRERAHVEQFDLPAVEIEHAELHHQAIGPDPGVGEDHRPAPGQKRGPELTLTAGGIGTGELLRRPTLGGNEEQRPPNPGRIDDAPIRAPGSAGRGPAHAGDHHRCASRGGDFLERAIGIEGDPVPVRGIEGMIGAVGPREGARRFLTQAPLEHLHDPRRGASDVGDTGAVVTDAQRPGAVELEAVGRIGLQRKRHREAGDPRRTAQRPAERGAGEQDNGGDTCQDGRSESRDGRTAGGRPSSRHPDLATPRQVHRSCKLRRTLKPVRRQLGERLVNRPLHLGRHRVANGADQRRLLGQHLGHDRLRVAAGVGRVAGQHLIEHRAQRIDVAPCVECTIAHGLFGAHVLRRAERHPGLRHPGGVGRGHGERDAEVRHQGALVVQQDVLGFDVAVDDPPPVRVIQCAGYLGGQPHRVLERELLLAVQAIAQRLSFDEGHHIPEQAVGFARIDQPEDMGMLQVGGGLDLPQKPLGPDHRGELGLEQLEGHPPIVPDVLGQVHRRHPTRAELALDAVAVGQGRHQAGRDVRHGKECKLPAAT